MRGTRLAAYALAFTTLIVGLTLARNVTAEDTLTPGPAVVTARDGLSLRAGPSKNHKRLAVMPYSSRVSVNGPPTGVYYPVTWKDRTGWAHGGWLGAAAAAARPAITTTDLRLRRGPSTEHGTITVMDKGSRVTITGAIKNGFVPVLFRAQAGWAAARYLADPEVTTLPRIKQRVLELLTNAGLHSQWAAADAIIACESGWNPLAENTSGAHPMRGLWQINWGVHAYRFAGLDWKNPVHNTRVAIAIYRDSGNTWSAWHCNPATSRAPG